MPIPIAIALSIGSGVPGLVFSNFALAALAMAGGILSSYLFYRITRPEFSLAAKGPLGPLLMAGGFALYVFGAFESTTALQLAGILVVCEGSITSLGGPQLAFTASPFIISTLVASVSSRLPTVSIAFASGMIAIPCIGIMLLRKSPKKGDCPRCNEYRFRKMQYCMYCGNLLSSRSFPIPSVRVVALTLVTMTVLIVSVVSVPVVQTGSSGITLVSYSISGGHTVWRIATPASWTSTAVSYHAAWPVQPQVYELRKPGSENLTVSTAYSTSQQLSEGSVLAQYPNATMSRAYSLPDGSSASLVSIQNRGAPLEGLLWSGNALAFNGTAFQGVSIAYLAVQNGNKIPSNSSAISAVTSGFISDLDYAQPFNPFIQSLVVPGLYLGSFAGVALLLAVLVLGFESVRRADLEGARVRDNMLGLTPREFSTLARMTSSGKEMRGYEMYSDSAKGSADGWESFEPCLSDFLRRGVLKAMVRVRRGHPAMLFKGAA